MRKIVFELCAESVEASLAARDGGASRIELCSALSEGGLTPSHGLVAEAVERSGLPVHVMIRPRGEDFVYSEAEFAVMRRDVVHLRSMGIAGLVFGLLETNGAVDRQRTAELVALAGPLEVTFHRAFDDAANLSEALEDLIRVGCHRVLTSGGEKDVATGAASLARLVTQSAGRIDVAVGGGLRLENAAAVARITEASHFHGSLRRSTPGAGAPTGFVDPRDVRMMIENLARA